MTLWILWSVATSTLVAGAAAALERAAPYVGVARRLAWMVAIVASIAGPLFFGLRRAPGKSPAAVGGPVRLRADSGTALQRKTLASERSVPRATLVNESSSPTDSLGSRHTATRLAWRTALARWSQIANRVDAWVTGAWIGASSILMLLLGTAVVRLGVRRSRWHGADSDVGEVLIAPDVGPAVVGFLHPRIVLPAWVLSIEARMRALLLRHELEHLRAGDTRMLLVAELALVMFPWNAALWWMVRRLRLAIEMDCDARVIRAVGGAYEYGSMLLFVGERYGAGLPLAASLVEPRSNLEARIHAIAAAGRRRPIAACLPLLAVAAIAIVTAAWTPRPEPLLRALLASRVARASTVFQRELMSSGHPAARRPPSARASVVTPSGHKTSSTVGMKVGPEFAHDSADPKPIPPFPAPVYPVQLRLANVEGHVLLRLRTDARGLPDTASIQIIESTDALFTAAVRDALRAWRFDSAGEVRLAFRFEFTSSEHTEAVNVMSPVFTIDGKPVEPVLITAPDGPVYGVCLFVSGRCQWPLAGGARRVESRRDSGMVFRSELVVPAIATPAMRDTTPEDSALSAAGYSSRRRTGRGFFMDGAMIDRQAWSFSRLMRIVPGFRISPTGNAMYLIEDARNPTSGCVNTFVDGTLWQPVIPGDIDEHVRPAAVLAVEAYDRTETPLQFTPRDKLGCATIVVWTRARLSR